MNRICRRIALKVDCDTFEGTKNGLPRLLHLFDQKGIKASFFFTLGPDRSGRAIRRIFTQKGFLAKMLRSRAVSLYGPKTMLYGTLLPAPMIGENLENQIRSVEEAGHEVGVHGWDHVRWHDFLDRMSPEEIEADYFAAHEVFQDIFGRKAHSSAAPGWHATADSLSIQEKFGLLYASDTRGGSPFFPRMAGREYSVLEIPTTLPTLDEKLADSSLPDEPARLKFYRTAVQGTEVHTIHTEVEGMSQLDFFEKQLSAWHSDGCEFLTLQSLAEELLMNRSAISHSDIIRTAIPNRGGLITSHDFQDGVPLRV